MTSKGNATPPETYGLTFDDAIYVWLRHWQGEYPHHIAASYSTSADQVTAVLDERAHVGSRAAAARLLAPAA